MTRSVNKRQTQTPRRRTVAVKLNKLTFQEMVKDAVRHIYGTGPYGQRRYRLHSTALLSLQEGAESFLEDFWEQLKDIAIHSGRRRIELRDVQVWKRTTEFKRRHKKSGLSLCKLFE
jgi:histone H3/H4